MSDKEDFQPVQTRIWLEEPEADNSFAARTAYCRGYDVYGEMLGNASWAQMLYLLFRDDVPSSSDARLLETLAVALANPGPRDPSVHAAMCGGVGGSTAASCLMAALAVGAGRYGGARDVYTAMQGWQSCATDLDAWRRWFTAIVQPGAKEVWPHPEHAPGFDPHGTTTPTVVIKTLCTLADLGPGPHLRWLVGAREALQSAAGNTLAMSGVAAAALTDLGFDPEQGEMLYLLLRLPGAAAHALEQRGVGYKKFPFFSIEIENDPANKAGKPRDNR